MLISSASVVWARVAGVIPASLSLLLNLVYIPYFPVWSIIVIAIDAFVIWALLTRAVSTRDRLSERDPSGRRERQRRACPGLGHAAVAMLAREQGSGT